MLDRGSADDLLRATVYDAEDNKVGRVGRVYLDDSSGQPDWVTVQTGLFGKRETFLPLGEARLDGERLIVPITKDAVKSAPQIDPDAGHLSLAEEEQLYRHYGLDEGGDAGDRDRVGGRDGAPYDGDRRDGALDDGDPHDGALDDGAPYDGDRHDGALDDGDHHDADRHDTEPGRVGDDRLRPDHGRDADLSVAGPAAGSSLADAPTATDGAGRGSEGAEAAGVPPAGMRLRRHLITEEQQITVPVVREEYVLEPDPDAESGSEPRTDT